MPSLSFSFPPGMATSFAPACLGSNSKSRWVSDGARIGLFAVLLVVYAGAMPYLITFSPLLLYGTYLVIGACAGGILWADWTKIRSVRWAAPYLCWALFYCYWGALVSTSQAPLDEIVKTYLKNFLIIGGLALAVIDRHTLRRLAQCVSVGVLVNVGIALWEVSHPELIMTLALASDPNATAFNVLRPAGLWSNPDEASFALLFGLLVLRWDEGLLAWAGRIGCITGIFLTASRTGAYVLFLFGAIYLFSKMRAIRLRAGMLALALLGFSLLLAIGAAGLKSSPLAEIDLSQSWQVKRILDFSQKDPRENGPVGRGAIAAAAAAKAVEGPWYGYGIYSFQANEDSAYAVLDVPSHNIYIAVWGETGLIGGVSYLVLLGAGFNRLLTGRFESKDWLVLLMMWVGFGIIGVTWHNQITSFAGMLYNGFLWHFPGLLGIREEDETAGRQSVRLAQVAQPTGVAR